MKQCEFCGASLANEASFCGRCGRILSWVSQQSTRISDFPTRHMEGDPQDAYQIVLSDSGKHLVPRSPSGVLHPITLVPIVNEKTLDVEEEDEENEDEEKDEEKRRRAALIGLSLPLLEELAEQPTIAPAPSIQGTPPIAQAPTVAGTPPIQVHSPGSHAVAGNAPLQQAHTPQPLFQPPQHLPIRRPPGPDSSTGGSSSSHAGCLTLGAIFVATVLIVLATFIGLGLTVLAPGLSLSGNSHVAPGSSLILHGSHFLPNGSVTLTLDSGTLLSATRPTTPARQTDGYPQNAASAGLAFQVLTSYAQNAISVRGDGTFDATIQVNPTWTPGQHTIHATEAVSHRNASLSFTITQASSTATPTPTPTEAPTPTPKPTPSPTPTATAVPPPVLSCATPGNLSLGPVSEFSSQSVSGKVTLCTAGSGTLTWRASWNQNQAPWLHIAQSSGFVQAPYQAQTTVSASAANLKAGAYTATVAFTGLESNTIQTINVTFTVKAGCVRAAPQNLSFTGVQGTSDPDGSQNISLTNCGLTSNWSANVTQGGNWLSISAGRGTLNGGATKTITATASNLKAELKAGSYQGTIAITIGSQTVNVTVTLTVQDAPVITASPTSCTGNGDGNSTCAITLTNGSSNAPLRWSSQASDSSVAVRAASGTIPAGGSEQVTIVVPSGDCGTKVTVNFTGPSNTATVTWSCIQVS